MLGDMADEPLSFANITQALDPLQREVDYIISEIPWEPPVTVRVRFAGLENPVYWNATLEWQVANTKPNDGSPAPKFSTNAERVKHQQDIANDMLARQDANDIYCFSLHIITDVRNLVDTKGRPVAYSAAAAEALLRALPRHVRFRLFEFCKQARNFYGVLERPVFIAAEDAKAIAGK
jgi:hypothetical protein